MKKMISAVLCLCFMLGMYTSVSAGTIDLAEYQNAIHRINVEFGLEYRLPENAKDLKKISVSDFETALRAAAQNARVEEAKANKKWKEALNQSDSLLPNGPVSRSRLLKSGYKNITGARVYFEGWALNDAGYWVWDSLNYTRVDTDYNNSSHRFTKESYTVKYLDARRTCAVNYTGTMHDKVLMFWIPRNATQYVEWWAGMAA